MRRMDANMSAMRLDLSNQLNEVKSKHEEDITQVRQDIDSLKQNEIKRLRETNTNQYALIHKLSEKVDSLEAKLVESNKKIKTMEVELYTSSQQSRRINLEIQGIPDTIHPDFLKDATVELLNSTGVTVKKKDIEAVHRLPSRFNQDDKPVIVRFANRTKCEDILRNKKEIQKFTPGDGSVLRKKRYYVSNNNCRYYNSLEYYCRKLKRAGEILGFKSSEGSLRVTLGNNLSKRIIHFDDLEKLFPDFAFEDQEDEA